MALLLTITYVFPLTGTIAELLTGTMVNVLDFYNCLPGTICGSPVDVRGIMPSSLVLDCRKTTPANVCAVAQFVPETLVLRTRSGEDSDKLASITLHMLEVLAGTELAVGNIGKIIPPKELTEPVNVASMHRVIGPVATVDLMRDGHRTVCGHVETEDKLLEVRPMILVDSAGNTGLVNRSLVASMECHCGRVVMDASGIQLELLDDV